MCNKSKEPLPQGMGERKEKKIGLAKENEYEENEGTELIKTH